MKNKRKFRNGTRTNRFNYMKTYSGKLAHGKWTNEKDSQYCDILVDGVISTVKIKEALDQKSCGISPTLLARTTDWLERRKGKDGKMEVKWVAGEFTEEMMDALTLILDNEKNGTRNRKIAAEKRRLKKEKEEADVVLEPDNEMVAEEKSEDNMTTVEEVLNHYIENNVPATEVIVELSLRVEEMRKENKETKELLNRMYQIFCEIAGVEPE